MNESFGLYTVGEGFDKFDLLPDISSLLEVPIFKPGELLNIGSVVGLYSPGPGFYLISFSSKFIATFPLILFAGPSLPITFFCAYYPGPGFDNCSFSNESRLVPVPNLYFVVN